MVVGAHRRRVGVPLGESPADSVPAHGRQSMATVGRAADASGANRDLPFNSLHATSPCRGSSPPRPRPMTTTLVAGGALGGRAVSLEVAGFVFTSTTLPGNLRLPRHAHERANLNVVLSGEYVETAVGRTRSHRPATVIAKPPGADHANALTAAGARCLVLELTAGRLAQLREHLRLFDDVRSVAPRAAIHLAARAAAELARPDSLSPVVLEGLALEIVAAAARPTSRAAHRAADRTTAAWLDRARGILHESPEDVTLSSLAAAVGLHPVYVARAFRARYGCAVGEYARRLRVDRAAREIVGGTDSLATIAARAGFADQSHFSRVFRRHTGLSPAAYRRACHDARHDPARGGSARSEQVRCVHDARASRA